MNDLDEQVLSIVEEYQNKPEYLTVDVIHGRIPTVDRPSIEDAITRLRSVGKVVRIKI